MRPTLTDDEVRELAELGRRIEEHYGAPQDTEWAFDPDGKVWMLQSRPVTSAGGDGRADGRSSREACWSGASALRPGSRAGRSA